MGDIPDRERGYSVERDTAVVHERYQDHAPLAMRTSALGVTNVANGRKPVACATCFPVKAKGGPVKPGESYLVGEHGPETFVSPAGGSIVSESEPA